MVFETQDIEFKTIACDRVIPSHGLEMARNKGVQSFNSRQASLQKWLHAHCFLHCFM